MPAPRRVHCWLRAELRRLASTCNFGEFMDDALHYRLVCGLASENFSRRLLADADCTTTFAKAVELAQSFEQADKNAKAVKGAEASLKKLSTVPRQQQSDRSQQRKPCYRCGKTNHDSKDCRFANATCNYCKKKGYIAVVCRKKIAQRTSNTKHVAPASSDSEAAWRILYPRNHGANDAANLGHLERGRRITLDGGRHRSSLFGDFWSNIPHSVLSPETPSLWSTAEIIYVRTYTCSRTTQCPRTLRRPTCSPGPLGCGRWWPEPLGKKLAPSHTTKLEEDTYCFKANRAHRSPMPNSALFKDKLGKIQQYEATPEVRPDAHSRFFKARPVPLQSNPVWKKNWINWKPVVW